MHSITGVDYRLKLQEPSSIGLPLKSARNAGEYIKISILNRIEIVS
jgi:hypothetical protein